MYNAEHTGAYIREAADAYRDTGLLKVEDGYLGRRARVPRLPEGRGTAALVSYIAGVGCWYVRGPCVENMSWPNNRRRAIAGAPLSLVVYISQNCKRT